MAASISSGRRYAWKFQKMRGGKWSAQCHTKNWETQLLQSVSIAGEKRKYIVGVSNQGTPVLGRNGMWLVYHFSSFLAISHNLEALRGFISPQLSLLITSLEPNGLLGTFASRIYGGTNGRETKAICKDNSFCFLLPFGNALYKFQSHSAKCIKGSSHPHCIR